MPQGRLDMFFRGLRSSKQKWNPGQISIVQPLPTWTILTVFAIITTTIIVAAVPNAISVKVNNWIRSHHRRHYPVFRGVQPVPMREVQTGVLNTTRTRACNDIVLAKLEVINC